MTRADSVLSTPPLNTSALTPIAGLDWLDIQPDASPADIFRAIGRLRKEARDEIDRLIRFLDESDNHMELEPDGDELDASWPESGVKATNPMEDDEDGADDEPSLGSTGHLAGGPIQYLADPISDGYQMVYDCEGDEHDGREPEHEDYDGKVDDEPSLGWTDEEAARGQYAGARGCMFDLEAAEPARAPQDRTVIDRGPLTVENGYRRQLRGLPPTQREAMRERMSYDSGVSLVGGPEWGMP